MPIPTIAAAGVYDMTHEEYHADPVRIPSLSSSIAKILIADTPRHAFTKHPRLNPDFKSEHKTTFDIGSVAHDVMLRDEDRLVIGDFDSWQTKAAKEFREEARRNGKIPLLVDQADRVHEMVRVGRAQIAVHQDSADAFTQGKPEQTLVWSEGETWFRIRLDWLFDDRRKPYYDYKTSENADPEVWWSRIAYSVGHDVQAAFYRRGIKALGLNGNPRIKFVVQETSAPFALSVVEPDKEALDLADFKLDRAIRRWAWCMKNGAWPAYPAYTHAGKPPPWAEQNYLDRLEREAGAARQAGIETADMLKLSIAWQAPQNTGDVI